jgi:hypothetical protein
MFVLLARDKAAPMAVRAWADERERKLRLMGRTDALVDEVLAEVDGDPVKAAEALAVEQASDKPRARLVEALTEIVTAPAADEQAKPE